MKTERLYNLVSTSNKTGNKAYLTNEPVSHKKAMVIKSKFNPRSDIRHLSIEEHIEQ